MASIEMLTTKISISEGETPVRLRSLSMESVKNSSISTRASARDGDDSRPWKTIFGA